ncbi:hypothetical protein [Aegicerativicinus sediminis]|uniref:hypothetical protein n=1 Tax=Aegicerativicinus sediminis TaxID=2893202 RepID=UPI001E35E68E|nr:hypothetical protein [Aegicerativicinus sediminis]
MSFSIPQFDFSSLAGATTSNTAFASTSSASTESLIGAATSIFGSGSSGKHSGQGLITQGIGLALNAVFPGAGIIFNQFAKSDFLGIFSGVGDILANGFDLSCWGSTYNPAEETKVLEEKIAPVIQEAFAKVQSSVTAEQLTVAINELSQLIHCGQLSYEFKIKANNWSKCTKKALQLGVDFHEPFKQKFSGLVAALRSNFNVTSTGYKVFPDNVFKWKTGYEKTIGKKFQQSMKYPTYRIIAKAGSGTGSPEGKKSSPSSLIIGAVLSKVLGIW